MNPTPINRTAHHHSVTHCTIFKRVSLLKSKFFSRASGPSASTARHLRKTSQYPWKLSHGAPGLRLRPLGRPGSPNSEVDLHFLDLSKQAKSQSFLLSTLLSLLDKKHSSNPNLRQIDPLHSPPWQTCVPSLQGVRSVLGVGFGHCGV